MVINKNKTIGAIKQEFAEKFTGLSLEFYKKAHDIGEASLPKDLLSDHLKIYEVSEKHLEGKIQISEQHTVEALEEKLWTVFGLSAQVFYRAGKVRLQTTASDRMTLAQLIGRGKQYDNFSTTISST